MVELKITELNKFMGKLLKSEVFDDYMLRDGLVRTYMDFSFDGEIHSEWFDTSELETMSGMKYVKWESLRGQIFELIKGKHTPLVMQFRFIASNNLTEKIIGNSGAVQNQTVCLNMNITYKAGNLVIVTGVYRSGFSLDKTIDNLWDSYIQDVLKKENIVFEVF